jgi:hypothetical protein
LSVVPEGTLPPALAGRSGWGGGLSGFGNRFFGRSSDRFGHGLSRRFLAAALGLGRGFFGNRFRCWFNNRLRRGNALGRSIVLLAANALGLGGRLIGHRLRHNFDNCFRCCFAPRRVIGLLAAAALGLGGNFFSHRFRRGRCGFSGLIRCRIVGAFGTAAAAATATPAALAATAILAGFTIVGGLGAVAFNLIGRVVRAIVVMLIAMIVVMRVGLIVTALVTLVAATAVTAPATARSRSASAMTIIGLLPPNSSVAGISLSAALRATIFPVSTEPVKVTLRAINFLCSISR